MVLKIVLAKQLHMSVHGNIYMAYTYMFTHKDIYAHAHTETYIHMHTQRHTPMHRHVFNIQKHMGIHTHSILI